MTSKLVLLTLTLIGATHNIICIGSIIRTVGREVAAKRATALSPTIPAHI